MRLISRFIDNDLIVDDDEVEATRAGNFDEMRKQTIRGLNEGGDGLEEDYFDLDSLIGKTKAILHCSNLKNTKQGHHWGVLCLL